MQFCAQVNVSEETVQQMNYLEEQGRTEMLVAVDGQWAGIVAVADTIKDTWGWIAERLGEFHGAYLTGAPGVQSGVSYICWIV